MKTAKFLYLFLFIIFLVFDSCSDDDLIRYEVPESPTEGILQDEVRLLFCPNAQNDFLTIKGIYSVDKNAKVFVNWGDDDVLHTYKQGEIKYQYVDVDREYIVTLRLSRISDFYYTHTNTALLTKELVLGSCPDLNSFFTDTYKNSFENLDLSRCPQLSGDFYLRINAARFNFQGLRNFSRLSFHVDQPIDIEMRNMNMSKLELNFADQYNNIPELSLIACNELTECMLNLSTRTDVATRVDKLEIEAPRLEYLHFSGIRYSELDLASFENLSSLVIVNSLLKGILFPPSLECVTVSNQDMKFQEEPSLSFDFGGCLGLKILNLIGIENLKFVNIEGLTKLDRFYMDGCPNASIIR